MPGALRIGNAHGFWGDRLEAAAEMLAHEPELDFLTLDFLAEVSMSILARQRQRNAEAGFAADFVDIIESLAPYWSSGGTCRVISNAGGLNPVGCAEKCKQVLERAGCRNRTIGVVTGDDVLPMIRVDAQSQTHCDLSRNLDTGAPIHSVVDRLTTANAYLGAAPIAEALDRGADLVITGRVADPSLTVGACVHHFGWAWDQWDRLAGATVAGHLIECGTQVTGGISTDWLNVPDVDRIGFPIAEVEDDGSCVITKPRRSGGCVTESTVKEQLLYEIGDPDNYVSPDAVVSFLSLDVRQQASDRIRVSGARGRPAPDTLKVSATWQAGYRATGQLTVFGKNAVRKARRAGDIVLRQLRAAGVTPRDVHVDIVGTGACGNGHGMNASPPADEVVLRIAVADDSREKVEQFTRAMAPLITAGPPGTTGYAEGRPRVHPHFCFWPCLLQRQRVTPKVKLIEIAARDEQSTRQQRRPPPLAVLTGIADPPIEVDAIGISNPPEQQHVLAEIAHARSGDKGRNANIGVIARQPQDFDRLKTEVTAQRVASYLGIQDVDRIMRYELPNLAALNFVIHDFLSVPLRLDAQGKALGQALLQMPLTSNQKLQKK